MAVWLLYFLVVLVILCLLCLGMLVHAGFFSDLRIRTSVPASFPHRVAYTIHTGPYKKVGSAFSRIASLAPKQTYFGAFYDDPREVPAAKLRCIVGCVLPESGANSTELEASLKASGYSLWTFPPCNNAIITEFVSRNFLSCWIAQMIVYPALHKYLKKRDLKIGGPVIEVYYSEVIRYIVPLENNPGFFVPEVAQEEESKKEQ